MRLMKARRAILGLAALALVVSGCSWSQDDASVVLRSDPPITGMVANLQYVTNGAPNGLSSENEITTVGINGSSPMASVHTTFNSTDASRVQSADVTAPNGSVIHALGMGKWSVNVGLSEYLKAQIGTYEQRDVKGNRLCGVKVRMTFQPNLFEVLKNDKKNKRSWDSIAYYSVPCAPVKALVKGAAPDPAATLDLAHAKFMALVITQQFTPRLTGKPILFNRGHSVTVVGGSFATLQGGWWQSAAGLITGSNKVVDIVRDLDGKSNDWLRFSDPSHGDLVYSAGDADVYLSLKRLFLNRQSDYMVNFRAKPTDPWHRILVHPRYNQEWNDWSQNWKALKGQKAPDIDDLVNQDTGLPKDLNDSTLKEVETTGCQNCTNPSLEQIQFINPDVNLKQPIWALTIRGYLGAERSLFMMGGLPNSSANQALQRANTFDPKLDPMQDTNKCPVKRNEKGEKVEGEQYTPKTCAMWLREGSLWDMLTGNPAGFGFDLVGQFRVRDDSSYASQCSGSGDSQSCTTVATNMKLNANYLLSDVGANEYKSWAILQLLGEVGMRTLGMSYASDQYGGSGIDFALAQGNVSRGYYSDLTDPKNPYSNPEMVFDLDARALQTPEILRQASVFLGYTP